MSRGHRHGSRRDQPPPGPDPDEDVGEGAPGDEGIGGNGGGHQPGVHRVQRLPASPVELPPVDRVPGDTFRSLADGVHVGGTPGQTQNDHQQEDGGASSSRFRFSCFQFFIPVKSDLPLPAIAPRLLPGIGGRIRGTLRRENASCSGWPAPCIRDGCRTCRFITPFSC